MVVATPVTPRLTEPDRVRLQRLIDVSRPYAYGNLPYLDALQGELHRADIVPLGDIPDDIVTMNSRVRLRDLKTGHDETYTLVFPALADPTEGRLSVLAPAGTAILGCRVGDVVEWPVPSGARRVRIEEVLSQPEREGRRCL